MSRELPAAGILLVVTLALGLVGWMIDAERRPLLVSVARMLRRAGRWLWAAGEGLEYGFRHSQQVRREISLELEDAR
jgi:hypothetical protein